METQSVSGLLAKIENLEKRLSEADQLIDAIKAGEVDAFAIVNDESHEVYTLQSGDYAYRVLVEKFHEGALNLTEEGLIVYTNTYFHQFLNLPYEKVVGTSFKDYIAEDSQHIFQLLFRNSLTGNSKGEINLLVNGTITPVYVSLTSLQPHLATIGLIITDLTEKKSHEKIVHGFEGELELKNQLLLNKNKQLEQQILNEFSESFAEYKTGKEFFDSLTLSLAQKTQLDYTFLGELLNDDDDHYVVNTLSLTAFGKTVDNIQYPLAKGPCEQVIRNALYSFPINCRSIFPDNETIKSYDVEGYVGYPLFDTTKKPIGLIAVMHRQEIEDVAYTETLLKIAAKRTELEIERIRNEKMLATQNIELQNQNAELASFSYIASHDLQEPLRKIQAFSSRILEKEGPTFSEAGKDYFARINDSAARMQNLIEALLNYSRTNTTDFILESTELNKAVEDVIQDLQEKIAEHEVKITLHRLPTLKIVPIQFHQLFYNIISNAIKYRKVDVSPEISISSAIVPASEIKSNTILPKARYWKIQVSDNGIGFEPKHETKVFELFQRLHGKTEYEGTGIGLAICKKIMQNHCGFITAAGKPGIGATFNLYFPVEE